MKKIFGGKGTSSILHWRSMHPMNARDPTLDWSPAVGGGTPDLIMPARVPSENGL